MLKMKAAILKFIQKLTAFNSTSVLNHFSLLKTHLKKGRKMTSPLPFYNKSLCYDYKKNMGDDKSEIKWKTSANFKEAFLLSLLPVQHCSVMF